MPALILLFSHTLTDDQRRQANLELGVDRIIEPPPSLRRLWSSVPPEEETLVPVLETLVSWLDDTAAPGDFVLVQGDFGACYLLVRHCFEQRYVPIYSTTGRHAMEEHLLDGSVQLTHRFNHVRFRKYGC